MKRILNNWPQKLAALLLAFAVWLFVATDDTHIVQRSMLVALQVEGVAEDQVAAGVPEVVEVTISGPEHRVVGMRPGSIEAVIDLRGAEGEFERPVAVSLQQGVNLVRVVPSEVIGMIETIRSKAVPVRVALLGVPDQDVELEIEIEPDEVTASGRAASLDGVAFAVAAVEPRAGETQVTLFAADANARPVNYVNLSPERVTIRIETLPGQRRMRLPVHPDAFDSGHLCLEQSQRGAQQPPIALTNNSICEHGPAPAMPVTDASPTKERAGQLVYSLRKAAACFSAREAPSFSCAAGAAVHTWD